MNHKRVYRLYSEEGLSIRTKLPRRKRAWRYRAGRPQIAAPNDTWAMDFMSDALFDGRPFRLLTVVDCCSREGLATVPRANFRAFNVVEVLDRLAAERGKPKTIRVDNVLYAEASVVFGPHVSVRQHGCRWDSRQYIQAASAV